MQIKMLHISDLIFVALMQSEYLLLLLFEMLHDFSLIFRDSFQYRIGQILMNIYF
jgi:hypothetical protein